MPSMLDKLNNDCHTIYLLTEIVSDIGSVKLLLVKLCVQYIYGSKKYNRY